MSPLWLGFVVSGILIAVFVYLFVQQRRRKANQVPKHYVVLVDGFPATHVPREAVATMEEARGYVVGLKVAYRASWAVFKGIYKQSTREAPIDNIGMSMGPVHESHPDVVWFAPTSRMRLRFQPSMRYHFAGELHNMFRYNLYGITYIYKMKNKADKARAAKAQAWIESTYGANL
jgi:hypothetical protein